MKKPPVHGRIRDNRFIYGTRDNTGRTFIRRNVPRCPMCPTVPTLWTWDGGTGRDNHKAGGELERLSMGDRSLQEYIRYSYCIIYQYIR